MDAGGFRPKGKDTKLGLVVGLGVVLAVAVTYFPREGGRTGGASGNVVPSLPAVTRDAGATARLDGR
jgi:hypothetical protein